MVGIRVKYVQFLLGYKVTYCANLGSKKARSMTGLLMLGPKSVKSLSMSSSLCLCLSSLRSNLLSH